MTTVITTEQTTAASFIITGYHSFQLLNALVAVRNTRKPIELKLISSTGPRGWRVAPKVMHFTVGPRILQLNNSTCRFELKDEDGHEATVDISCVRAPTELRFAA